MSSFSPALVLMLGALIIPALPDKVRRAYLLLLPLLSFLLLRQLEPGAHGQFELFGYQLVTLRVDELSLLFGTLFHVALFLGILFALHVRDPLQHVSAFLYAGSSIGAVFAGDLITLFVYWEIVAVASVFLIWARRTPQAYAAGMRYLLFQIGSGVLLLAGILLYVRNTGSIDFDYIGLAGFDEFEKWNWAIRLQPAEWLILIAFGIKCAFPFVHTWLVDAYPEATPTGTVFLSSFTTKLAIYALIRAFPGTEVLVYIGGVMILFPIFFAVIENDLRRVLSYSMINQIGFMVIGVGIGTELALNGAAAHAFADVLFKGLLFMSMGAVLRQTGTVKASDLGGLYKSMPFTTACCLIGAISISAFPLFSAFATKSMIVSAVSDSGWVVVWFCMVFASAGVLHHAGIKIPFCAFYAHDSGKRPPPPPFNMRLAMAIAAILCVGIGCFPQLLYDALPYPTEYAPYTASHVVTQLQLLGWAILAFALLMVTGLHPPELPCTILDADWFWRRPGKRIAEWAMSGPLSRLAGGLQTFALETLPRLAVSFVSGYGPERGSLRKVWVLGSSIFVVMVLLVLYLCLGYLGRPGP